MADISSVIATFNKELDAAIDKAMQDDVFGAVRDIAIPQAVDEKVYEAYTPKKYKRRMTGAGGLQDPYSMIPTYDSTLKLLEVEDDARATNFPFDYDEDPAGSGHYESAPWFGNKIVPIVESGEDYIYESPDDPIPPRPFVHYAQELMMNNSLFTAMLNYGLAASGFDVS